MNNPTPQPVGTTRHRIQEVPGRTTPVPAPTREEPKPKKARKSRAKSTRVTKVSQVIGLLERPEGATMGEIALAIGWKEDSLRGFFAATLKGKKGLTLVSTKVEGRGRVYRIAKAADEIEEAI